MDAGRRIYRRKKCKICWPISLAARSCREARIETPAVCRCWRSALVAQVSDEDLRKGPNQNWLTYHRRLLGAPSQPAYGNQSAHHFAPRAEMGAAIPRDGRSGNRSARVQGVMYATIPNEVFALDAITGREIWHYRAEGARRARRQSRRRHTGRPDLLRHCGLPPGRSAAHQRRRDLGSGVRGRGSHYSCTAAPLAVKDKIVVGVASSGQTCFIAALSAETGNEAWRVWTVPRKGEPGSDTWGKFPLENGSAPAWTTGTYDPGLNLLYWPTGNPWPDFGGDRPGDNLYSDCVLALDPDTGKMKWYFQFVPHDTHDWDANEAPVLLDTEFRGRPRKLLVQANRNGFYYILDRTNGEFLLAEPFVKELNWANGYRRQRPSDRSAKQRPVAGRRARLSHGAWRHQLVVAVAQSGARPVLRRRARAVRDLLQLRAATRAQQRIPRHGAHADRRREGPVLSARARREDRQTALGIPDARTDVDVGRNCFYRRRIGVLRR